MLGKELIVLNDGLVNAGKYEVMFDNSSHQLPVGTYFFGLTSEDQTQHKKMVISR
jgi:hypothetical protein